MKASTGNLKKIGSVCLFLNGLILLFYAIVLLTFLHGVHWLITLVAVLFLVALPAIYHGLLQARKTAARIISELFGVAMIIIIVSDLLFAQSILSLSSHAMVYALGNALFVICLLLIGLVSLKGVFFKWFGYLSLLTGIVELVTYIPGIPGLLSAAALILLAVWSLAFGFNLLKTTK
ncbi:MAG TPA: hypothetical protein VLV31_02505 [Candidatus Acidoferrales bacterium]|nr:hypothetical protein [Candidatus Acidoferrales bacterium]